MSKSYSDGQSVNPSGNPHITEVARARLSRRDFLLTAAALPILSATPLAGCVSTPHSSAGRLSTKARATPGFASIDVSTDDAVRVPSGYTATTLYRWGDPIGHSSGLPAFKSDASNTADEQALQAGMHHDGIHYFPLPYGSPSSTRGLLAMNHEYTDDGLLHAGGFANWNAAKVRKAQNAHGCSVIEVALQDGRWSAAAMATGSRIKTAGKLPIQSRVMRSCRSTCPTRHKGSSPR